MTNYGDLAIPKMKLIQAMGGNEAKQTGARAGDFYCSITQEVIPGDTGFEIVVVKPIQKGRTYWPTEVSDEPPVCASEDAIMSVNGDICVTACPYHAFNDAPYMLKPNERRTKCTPDYKVMALKISDMMPVEIRCSGISAMAARELNTLLQFHKLTRGGQSFKAKIRVTSFKKKTASGDAYAIKFGNPELVEDVLLLEIQAQAAALNGVELPPEELQTGTVPETHQLAQAPEQLTTETVTAPPVAVAPPPVKPLPKMSF